MVSRESTEREEELFRITTKRELALLHATIEDQHKEILALRALVDHERKRSEGAINLLLLRTTKAVLTPQVEPPTEEQEEKMKERMLNIFGDEETPTSDEKLLEDLQK